MGDAVRWGVEAGRKPRGHLIERHLVTRRATRPTSLPFRGRAPCLLNLLNLRSAIVAGLSSRLMVKFCFAASPLKIIVHTAPHILQ
jgi:hypothetical protein